MRKTSCVILVLLMAIVLSGCKPKPSFTEGKRVVGYYAQWVADQRGYFVSSIPADKLTHINYAFANVTDDGKCVLGDVAADTERVYSAEESVSGKADSTDPAIATERKVSAHSSLNFSGRLDLVGEFLRCRVDRRLSKSVRPIVR